MSIGDIVIVVNSKYEPSTDLFLGQYGMVVDLHSDGSVEVELYASVSPSQAKLTERFKENDLEKIGEQTIWRE